MGIGSWWRKLRKREDVEAIQHAEERSYETPEERRATSDYAGLQADERAARSVREANVEDAERFAEGEDGP